MEEPHLGQDPLFDRPPDARSQTRTVREGGAALGGDDDRELIRDADARNRAWRKDLRAMGFDGHNGTEGA